MGELSWLSIDDANPYCTQVVATGIGHARNLGRTVVTLRCWSASGREQMDGGPGIVPVETPEEAVVAALAALNA